MRPYTSENVFILLSFWLIIWLGIELQIERHFPAHIWKHCPATFIFWACHWDVCCHFNFWFFIRMICLFSMEETYYMYITPSMANVLISKSTKVKQFTKLKQKTARICYQRKGRFVLVWCVLVWCMLQRKAQNFRSGSLQNRLDHHWQQFSTVKVATWKNAQMNNN